MVTRGLTTPTCEYETNTLNVVSAGISASAVGDIKGSCQVCSAAPAQPPPFDEYTLRSKRRTTPGLAGNSECRERHTAPGQARCPPRVVSMPGARPSLGVCSLRDCQGGLALPDSIGRRVFTPLLDGLEVEIVEQGVGFAGGQRISRGPGGRTASATRGRATPGAPASLIRSRRVSPFGPAAAVGQWQRPLSSGRHALKKVLNDSRKTTRSVCSSRLRFRGTAGRPSLACRRAGSRPA